MRNLFAKSISIALFSIIFVAIGAAQEKCELESKTAPLFLNLQIGMSPEQTQIVFGRALKIKIKKKGERVFFQNFIKNPAPTSLNGVRALYLRFFDGKLYQIEIFYENRQNLNSLEEVKTALSAQLNLSISDWEIKFNRAEINCGEISLVADYILNTRIEMTNEAVFAEIEELRKKKK